MQTCTASFPSLTRALAAQRALSHAAIPARIVRLSGEMSARGCAYGLEFSCAQLHNIKTVLTAAGLYPSRFFPGDTL